jgi:hypothetical protein
MREEELVTLQNLFEVSILINYFSILQRLAYAGWTKEEIEAARHTAGKPDDVPSLTYHPMFRQAAALTQTGTSIQSCLRLLLGPKFFTRVDNTSSTETRK